MASSARSSRSKGETVVGVDAVIGYLHRCHEKLAETLDLHPVPVDRVEDRLRRGDVRASSPTCARRRQIGKFEVPKRAQYLRVIVSELQRIASHCLWLGTWCIDMGGALGGGATIFLYCIRERELVLDLFEALVGARLLYGFHQVGGVRYDIPAGWAAQCRQTIALIEQRLDEYEDDARATTPSSRRAPRGVGTISRELAQTVGICGPLLRGSGVSYDIRRDRALLVLRGLRLQGAGRDRRRLLRALPGADGRVPRVDQHHPPGARRAAGGADLVAPRREVGGAGAGAEGRGLRARRRAARRGRLLPRSPTAAPSRTA